MDNNSLVKDPVVQLFLKGIGGYGVIKLTIASPALPYVLGAFGIYCVCNVISSIANPD